MKPETTVADYIMLFARNRSYKISFADEGRFCRK